MPSNEIKPQVHLHEGDVGDTQFVLHPGNDDLFVRTGRQLIAGCRLDISVELWLHEFDALCEFVNRWCVSHANAIRACYCSPRGAKLMFFFIPTLDMFDFDLATELAKLDIELMGKFNVGIIDSGQIPLSEIDRFFEPSTSRHIYGNHHLAHRTVAAQSEIAQPDRR